MIIIIIIIIIIINKKQNNLVINELFGICLKREKKESLA